MGASRIARTRVCDDSGGRAAVLYPALLCKPVSLLALMVFADEVPIYKPSSLLLFPIGVSPSRSDRLSNYTRGRLLSFKLVGSLSSYLWLSVRGLPRFGAPGLPTCQHRPDRSRQLVRHRGDSHAVRSAL